MYLQALNYAEKRGAICIGVTNTVGSAVSRGTKCGVHINAGCEIGVASTKAYTSQIVVLTMMALALSEDSISKAPMRMDIINALKRLPTDVKEVSSDQAYHRKGRVFMHCMDSHGNLMASVSPTAETSGYIKCDKTFENFHKDTNKYSCASCSPCLTIHCRLYEISG